MPGDFLDSNIVLYAFIEDEDRSERALALLNDYPIISVQVLNEFTNVARRKMRWPWPRVIGVLDTIRSLATVAPVTIDVHEAGLRVAQRYSLSTYDAMIAAAALVAGCTTLWSEDMQHGLLLENRLRVLNPFADI